MREPTEDWLEQINEGFGERNIPHGQRLGLALMEWASYARVSLTLDDNAAKVIVAWFKKNTKAGSQHIGALYTGAFFYDTCFWPVLVPIVIGTVRLNASDSLTTMPETVKARLRRDRNKAIEYACVWADCVDYGCGIERLAGGSGARQFAGELCQSGDQQLNATVALLLGETPNPKAMESARMATEMFLKAFLASRAGLTEKDAKDKIGHSVQEALNRCLTVEPHSQLRVIRPQIGCFPDIGDRYKGTKKAPVQLWQAYAVAQFTSATVVRSATGRDIRKTMRVR
jgi:hypothetical protein